MDSKVVFTGGHWVASSGKRYYPARIVSKEIDTLMSHDIVLAAGIIYDKDCLLLGNISLLLPTITDKVLDRKYLPLFETSRSSTYVDTYVTTTRYKLLRYYQNYASEHGGVAHTPYYFTRKAFTC